MVIAFIPSVRTATTWAAINSGTLLANSQVPSYLCKQYSRLIQEKAMRLRAVNKRPVPTISKSSQQQQQKKDILFLMSNDGVVFML